jgi:hypothetical protein
MGTHSAAESEAMVRNRGKYGGGRVPHSYRRRGHRRPCADLRLTLGLEGRRRTSFGMEWRDTDTGTHERTGVCAPEATERMWHREGKKIICCKSMSTVMSQFLESLIVL